MYTPFCWDGNPAHLASCAICCAVLDGLSVGSTDHGWYENALACVGASTSGTFCFNGRLFSVSLGEVQTHPSNATCPGVWNFYDITCISDVC
jgi:hypothetical protein